MYTATSNTTFSVKAYQGDAKTLLAFDLKENKIQDLAGFTIACQPGNATKPYYIYNKLQFAHPEEHAQIKNEPAYSSINAPIQKFRWLHVPGMFHQDNKVYYGNYTYTVTPRYFSGGKLTALDSALSVSVTIAVQPFVQGNIALGFTRGFVQSQAFEHHFGKTVKLKPHDTDELLFDTDSIAGKNSEGKSYTFKDEYTWSGFTVRQHIFDLLDKVQKSKSLYLDVFAYDLNEPDVMKALLALAKAGRVRVILDNATLHHNTTKPKPEDSFEDEFDAVKTGQSEIKRGKFSRYQHNKIFIVRQKSKPIKVLTGSTNFSITGCYVNSNHVLVFDDEDVAKLYADVFNQAWDFDVKTRAFTKSEISKKSYDFKKTKQLPEMQITFAPHADEFANATLESLAGRVKAETNSVIFAVMEMDKSGGPVVPTLKELHRNDKVFSMGISDTNTDIVLYKPSQKTGIKVCGKTKDVVLPPPFNKEPGIGLGHQIHHKFIVCGFNTDNAVVWCGSSNLAQGGEQSNGDNLLEIHDKNIATVFAIEGMALVDHFQFRNARMQKKQSSRPLTLYTSNKWALSYYNKNDLHYSDRMLFR